MKTRRILAFVLAALLVCVVAIAQTNNIKRPTKKAQRTTKTETKRTPNEKKPKRTSKRSESKNVAKSSETPKTSAPVKKVNNHLYPELVYTPNVLAFNVNGVSFQMVEVRGGTFRMGATSEQGSDAEDNEKPDHNVSLGGYYIGKTEVTQALWAAVMGETVSHVAARVNEGRTVGIGPDYPMYYISWEDCQTFIEKLNRLTGKKFRLPTEAEWEFACRGGNNSRGYKYSGGNDVNSVAWYEGNSGSQTHPVGTKAPNELGIYDMSGNVWEWCADWYGDYKPDYYDSYTTNSQINPTGPTSGSYRVNRGGSWDDRARYCRSSCRSDSYPTYRCNCLGLRLAL